MEINFREIQRLTELSKTNEIKRLLKLIEEIGEVSEAINSSNNEIGYKYKNKTKDDVCEELCDVIIVALSMITLYSKSFIDVNTIINKKLIKWNNIILNNKKGDAIN